MRPPMAVSVPLCSATLCAQSSSVVLASVPPPPKLSPKYLRRAHPLHSWKAHRSPQWPHKEMSAKPPTPGPGLALCVGTISGLGTRSADGPHLKAPSLLLLAVGPAVRPAPQSLQEEQGWRGRGGGGGRGGRPCVCSGKTSSLSAREGCPERCSDESWRGLGKQG